jgi:hypothetical protein
MAIVTGLIFRSPARQSPAGCRAPNSFAVRWSYWISHRETEPRLPLGGARREYSIGAHLGEEAVEGFAHRLRRNAPPFGVGRGNPRPVGKLRR